MKLSFTILILYFVMSAVPLHEYHVVLSLLSLLPITAILLLVLIQIILLAARWYLLAKAAGSHLSLRISVYGILMSFFFSQGLPASVGGDAFRIWWHRREGIFTGVALKIIFFDRIYGLLSLVILCSLSLIMLTKIFGNSTIITSLIFLVTIIGLMLALLMMPCRLGVTNFINVIASELPRLVRMIIQWVTSMRSALSKQPLMMTLILLLLGCLTHLMVVLQVYVIGSYLTHDQVNLMMCLAVVPPALLISYMPFSIAGWGVREASLVVAFGLFGIHASSAIIISIVIGMSILAISLVGGLVWVAGGYRAAYVDSSADC